MIKALFNLLCDELSMTQGEDFHLGRIPANAQDNCSALLNRVGTVVDDDNPNFRQFRFQIYTRNEKYVAGDEEAYRIFDLAVLLRGESLDGWYLYDVTGTGPAHIGTDAKGREEFSANISVSARKE